MFFYEEGLRLRLVERGLGVDIFLVEVGFMFVIVVGIFFRGVFGINEE